MARRLNLFSAAAIGALSLSSLFYYAAIKLPEYYRNINRRYQKLDEFIDRCQDPSFRPKVQYKFKREEKVLDKYGRFTLTEKIKD